MSGALVFLHLAGAVALLLWATRMVRTGIERAYGGLLRRRLRPAFSNRANACVSGLLLAVAMQSSTAVALLACGFVGGAYMSTTAGFAALLGADLGSALVTRILRLDLTLLAPVLLVIGTAAFRASEARRWRQAGRIMIGLGLLLLSLSLIREAGEPLRDSRVLPVVMGYLEGDWITVFLIAALTAWLFHSSVAAILFFATLLDQQLIPTALIAPLVLGVNLGGSAIAVSLSRGMPAQARSVPIANLVLRGTVAIAALALIAGLPPDTAAMLAARPGDAGVALHIAFNTVVLAIGLGLAGVLPGLVAKLIPATAAADDALLKPATMLSPADLGIPRQALANASRAVMAMCGQVSTMLENIFELMRVPDEARMSALVRLDDEIDHAHTQVKLYLARIKGIEPDSAEMRRLDDLLNATIRLEQVADILSRNLAGKARKKLARGIEFSAAGWRELDELHEEVLKNARLAFNVLASPDLESARQLVRQKEVVRTLEQRSEARHLDRLRQGNADSLASSNLHIDVLRDLKEINSLLAALAYPVLEEAGLLRESRLRAAAP